MRLTGESMYISSKTGKKKDSSDWFSSKFLDDESDEFFTVFLEEDLYHQLSQLPKHTPVMLTLNLVPGQKYFSLENVEVLND